jgi:hypothetical protein
MNPEDAAAERFKPIRQAREHIAKAEQAHAAALARLEELRGELGPAERRDRERLGEALVANRSEPPAEAEQLKAEVVRQEARVEALRDQTALARARIPRLVDAHRGSWLGKSRQELSREQRRYAAAIEELQAAREALSDVATLIGWLQRGDVAEAATDSLAGRSSTNPNGPPVLAFSRVLEALREDVEHLTRQPARGDAPELRLDTARVKVGALLGSQWGGE